jgi:hypothetical protein
VRDSSGISGTGETPNGAKRQEAHRAPRGKRAPGAEINHFQEQQSLLKQTTRKLACGVSHRTLQPAFAFLNIFFVSLLLYPVLSSEYQQVRPTLKPLEAKKVKKGQTGHT